MGDYTQHISVKASSEKSFGVVFGIVFGIIATWPLINGSPVRLWALGVAGVFLLTAFIQPAILRPLNRLWFQFGLALGKITTPIIMGGLFLTTVTPIGLIMRAFGKDPLKLKLDSKVKTYWIERAEPGPKPGSMRNQF
jgi:hypothetical protein